MLRKSMKNNSIKALYNTWNDDYISYSRIHLANPVNNQIIDGIDFYEDVQESILKNITKYIREDIDPFDGTMKNIEDIDFIGYDKFEYLERNNELLKQYQSLFWPITIKLCKNCYNFHYDYDDCEYGLDENRIDFEFIQKYIQLKKISSIEYIKHFEEKDCIIMRKYQELKNIRYAKLCISKMFECEGVVETINSFI